jgi:hypothetical protein
MFAMGSFGIRSMDATAARPGASSHELRWPLAIPLIFLMSAGLWLLIAKLADLAIR